ncbi:uncharacterized protein LOC130693391 [Daphnia carinata]|uniref:uncharacterized protein LOC130693391 n=1 Tax=Daphnia carinata TaxID=120202 RepID=UPI00257A3A81|nr:uncharacterized protein LOC130693391 [Daphnia carinata]
MRLIFLMTLAGALALDSLNANERVQFGNKNIADHSNSATFVLDGKFTVQLLVSIEPAEEEIVGRRTVFANRRRPNRKEEMSSNCKEEFSLQLADQDAILRTKVVHKNEGQRKTFGPKNRFHRLPTTTTRYPTPTNSGEDLPWDSRKTKNVKGSVMTALKRTLPTRPRINRIRTTTLRSPVSTNSRKTHFAVEHGFDNGLNKSRAVQNQNLAAVTVAEFQKQQKEVDAINLEIAANEKVNATQSTDASYSDLIHSKEEPQVQAPIFQNTSAGHESAIERQPTTEIMPTQTVDIKLPLPLNWRKPIAKEPDVSDVTQEPEGQVFPVNETLIVQDAQNSSTTTKPVLKHSNDDKLSDEGYDNEHEKSIISDKRNYGENKEGDSFSKNEESGTNPTMATDNALSVNPSNSSVLVFSFSEGQREEIAKFDEPIFRHSVADREFSSEITTPAGDFTTSAMEVIHLQPNILAVNSPTILNPIPVVNEPDVVDEITTEPVLDFLPITEIPSTHGQSYYDEDPNDFPWKQIGDIEIQINPQTKEVINIKSQTISGVQFIMATSHIPISLHSEESHVFPWERIGNFEVQMNPQTKQVVNIRTQTTERTETRVSDPIRTQFEQHVADSREEKNVHHHPNLSSDDTQIQLTTEVVINQTETVATVSLQTTNPLRLPPQESEATHTGMIAVELPTTINSRRTSVIDSGQFDEISEETDDDVTTRKKQVVRVDDRLRAIRVHRPSSRNSEEHDVFLLRYVDEEDDVPLDLERARGNSPKKKNVVIVNRDERRIGGQRGDSLIRKESPYFYYHYDTSRALTSSSCHLPILVGYLLLLFFML